MNNNNVLETRDVTFDKTSNNRSENKVLEHFIELYLEDHSVFLDDLMLRNTKEHDVVSKTNGSDQHNSWNQQGVLLESAEVSDQCSPTKEYIDDPNECEIEEGIESIDEESDLDQLTYYPSLR